MITIEGGIIWPNVPEAEITPVANSGEYLFLSIVGNDNNPIVTTVAPTIPVDAAKNAPTTTTETAKPPGKWPNTLAIVVNNSPAIFDLSSVMPINTNIKTASKVSIDWPAITLSFILLTTNEIFLVIAFSHPPGKSACCITGNSGYRNTDMSTLDTPCAINSLYCKLEVSITEWTIRP